MIDRKLEAKVGFITGGAIGIGEACVRQLVAGGGKAVIIDTNAARAEAIVAELPSGSAIFAETDVANEASVIAAIEAAVVAFGRIDIAINSAGITSLVGPVLVEDVELEDWNRMMGINLTGAFLVTKHVVRRMKAQRYGRIVNISSTAALGGGYRGAAPYAASKAGLVGLTREVAREVGSFGITVNAIGPGPTKTPTRRILVEREAQMIKLAFLPRPTTSLTP